MTSHVFVKCKVNIILLFVAGRIYAVNGWYLGGKLVNNLLILIEWKVTIGFIGNDFYKLASSKKSKLVILEIRNIRC